MGNPLSFASLTLQTLVYYNDSQLNGKDASKRIKGPAPRFPDGNLVQLLSSSEPADHVIADIAEQVRKIPDFLIKLVRLSSIS